MISCPKCNRVSQEADPLLGISELSDDCDVSGGPAADGNVVTASQMMAAVPVTYLPSRTHGADITARPFDGLKDQAPQWGEAFAQHTQHLISVGVDPEALRPMPGTIQVFTTPDGALQRRIRDLQEQNERLAALVDEKEKTAEHLLAKLTDAAMLSLPSPAVVSRAPVVRWVALSSGWHHWPCVTTGAKAPEREQHPLHRAIAVRKEPFPR